MPATGSRAASTLTTQQVRDALVASGVAGPHVSHGRAGSISKIEPLIAGDPDKTFGLSGMERHTPEDVLAWMAKLTGCNPDIGCLDEDDYIDPVRTVQGIVEAATRLAQIAAAGGSLLAATGHPTGMLEHHMRVVDAFARAGGKVIRLREGEKLPIGKSGRHSEVRYIGGVGCLADWGSLKHTHLPDAMEALLESRPWPDIVLADHGFAGAAIERGIPVIAVVDINDHALAVAWGEGRDITPIPLDDNRPPRVYEPSWRLFEQVLLEGWKP